tara:strand:+ start:72 stop:350 length:279 start_codon:yes stop_codon:yes gene_type:complete
MKVAAVINPRPPTVIIVNIVICPKVDQYSGVDTAVCPVTVAADVAVRIAIRNGVKLLLLQVTVSIIQLLEMGNNNNMVPTSMKPKNASNMNM